MGNGPSEHGWGADWPEGPRHPLLAQDEVHVWLMPLGAAGWDEESLRRRLDDAEQSHLRRLTHPASRRRYLISHGLTRLILSRYVNRPAESLQIRRRKGGKPELWHEGQLDWVRFNLSHADDVALLAVAGGRDVGIDVERLRTNVDVDSVAAHVLGAAESHRVAQAAGAEKLAMFFDLWTRHEAMLKALGLGLDAPIGPGVNAVAISCGEGYFAAVATIGAAGRVVQWSMGPESEGN